MSGAAFSYASFSRGPGGWQVGETVGSLSREQVRSLIGAVPTQLSDGTPIPTYPDKAERDRLVRRFSWLPAPWDPLKRVFSASVPAGLDATGRPGNVFTYVTVTATPDIPVSSAVQAFYSPDIPTPFGPRETETVRIPAQPSAPGPVADLLPLFLDGWADDEAPLPGAFARITNEEGTRRRGLVRHLAAELTTGRRVILAAPPAEAALWVAAVATEDPSLDFCFSTFERFNSVTDVLGFGAQLVVVPPSDAERVRGAVDGVTVIATTDEIPASAPVALDLDGALNNPFGDPAPAPEPEPLRADRREQMAALSGYLAREGVSADMTVGLTITPTAEQNRFLRNADVQEWIRVLRREVTEPLDSSHVLAFLLFPPTTGVGKRTRAMVLAAETLIPGASHRVSSMGWLFDAPEDVTADIVEIAADEISGVGQLSSFRMIRSPLYGLVQRVVEKHNHKTEVSK